MYFSFYHFLSKLQNCVKWSTTNTFWFHCYYSGSASPSEWIKFQLAHRRTATPPNLLQPDILVRKGPVRTRLCERWVQEEKWGAGPEGKGRWRDKVKRGKVTVTEDRNTKQASATSHCQRQALDVTAATRTRELERMWGFERDTQRRLSAPSTCNPACQFPPGDLWPL